ncbi:MAG: DUF368 domain-containing protein [Bacillota bacterium]|nr:DUF368 domain-containing protein [Bacillota bacterium]
MDRDTFRGDKKEFSAGGNNASVIIKGMVIGGTMMVPGASGGTMAMILGIYDQLIRAISSFMKHKLQSFMFLLLFCAGGSIGMFLLSRPVLYLLENYRMPTMYFFIGAIAGGMPLIVRESKGNLFSVKRFVHICIGVVLVLLVSQIPAGSFDSGNEADTRMVIFLAAAGFISAVALVLPGISVSYLLLVLGLYDETIMAVSQVYMPFLIPLGTGLMMGVILTTKCLERAMDRYPLATYSVIMGFVAGSVVQVFPGIPEGSEVLLCILTLIAGFCSIYMLSRREA